MIAAIEDSSNGQARTPAAEPRAEHYVPMSLWFLRRPDLSAPAKLVALALSDRIGWNESTWPEQEELAADVGLSRSTIKRCIRELVAAGLLATTSRGMAKGLSYKSTGVGQCEPQGRVNLTFGGDQPALRPRVNLSHAEGQLELPPRAKLTSPVGQLELTRNQQKEPTELSQQKERSSKPQRVKFSAEEIERIYQAYPRLIGKGKALPAIGKALGVIDKRGNRDPVGWLLDRVVKFAGSAAGQQGKYTPHPATWMNTKRYEDDDSEWANSSGNERKAREFPEPVKQTPRLN